MVLLYLKWLKTAKISLLWGIFAYSFSAHASILSKISTHIIFMLIYIILERNQLPKYSMRPKISENMLHWGNFKRVKYFKKFSNFAIDMASIEKLVEFGTD